MLLGGAIQPGAGRGWMKVQWQVALLGGAERVMGNDQAETGEGAFRKACVIEGEVPEGLDQLGFSGHSGGRVFA